MPLQYNNKVNGSVATTFCNTDTLNDVKQQLHGDSLTIQLYAVLLHVAIMYNTMCAIYGHSYCTFNLLLQKIMIYFPKGTNLNKQPHCMYVDGEWGIKCYECLILLVIKVL